MKELIDKFSDIKSEVRKELFGEIRFCLVEARRAIALAQRDFYLRDRDQAIAHLESAMCLFLRADKLQRKIRCS